MQPIRSDSGLFIVSRREHFVYWCAWREWLATRCGYTFFPDTRTTFSEWPPQTIEEVKTVVGKLNESRRVANADSKVKGKLLPMLQEELAPWDKWPIERVLEIERRHKADPAWNPALHGPDPEEKLIGADRAAAVIAATRKRFSRKSVLRIVEPPPE